MTGVSQSAQLSYIKKDQPILKVSQSARCNVTHRKDNCPKQYCSKASGHVIDVQDTKDFQKRVLNNQLPVVVDFYADWCGPCKLLVPKLESLVSKNHGKLVLAKINIEQQSELADEYQVMAVPTVIAMKNGKQIDRFVGFKDDDALETFIAKLIR